MVGQLLLLLKMKVYISGTMANRLHLATLFFLFVGMANSFSQVCDCVSTGNCPVPITDNGTYCGVLNVTVDGPNDLEDCPLTSVCFTITHTWIGDLSATLTSPSGVSYILMADDDNNFGGCGDPNDNIDVCFVPGTGNPLTNNTPYPSGSAGPCGGNICYLTGDWTLACGGVTDEVTMVPQAPNCDLDDFNVAGDPANGDWTLCVNDVCNMDTGTLDNFSLNFACGTQACIVCDADGGQIDTTTFRSCEGNPNLLLNLPPDYGALSPPDTTEYGYGYIISQGGIVLEYDTVAADLTSQPAGTYQVHGFSYLFADSTDLNYMVGLDTALLDTQLMSTTAPFCGDLSETFMTIIIEEIPAPVVIDTIVCAGECIMVNGGPICADSTITLTSWLGCDSVIQVTITEISVSAVISPSSPPTLTCANPTTMLDGSSSTPGTVTYQWTGPNSFNETTASVTVSEPGTYTLTVSESSANPACEATTTIEVLDGFVEPDLVIGAAPSLCVGDAFDLSSMSIVDNNGTSPVITFHSGTPATPGNELASTTISPSANTTYYVLATSGNCSDEEAINVTVADVPTSDFTSDGPTCVTASTTIEYTGTGTAGAVYDWDFGGGTATPSTGAGPHDVTWPNSGTYTVTLTVEENGCTSTTTSVDVVVEAELAAPVVSCNTTTSSVEFVWSTVPGADDYTINVISAHTGTLGAGGTTYLVTGLSPNEEVTIEVIANGSGACGNSSAQQSCTAQDCPTITVDIDPVSDICLTSTSSAFDLDVTVTGGDGAGTLDIQGDGITSPTVGTFDPQVANIGSNSIVATYTQGNCAYTGNVSINVNQTPTAEFTATTDLCQGDASTVTFTGTAPAGSNFIWNFDGGTANPGTGAGPHDVTWPDATSHTISLEVASPEGCTSTTEFNSISIDAPLTTPAIGCDVTTNSVTFDWTADPDVDSYNVTSVSGHSLTMVSATEYEVTGLSPNESVTIQVEAIGTGPCGNVTVEHTCTAQDCPPVMISIDPVSSICTDASTTPFVIPNTITGMTPDGMVVWSGPGIINTSTGEFDPLQANEGNNLVTATVTDGACVFTESIVIEVYPTPDGSISATAAICTGEPTVVEYFGDPTGLIFNWNFGGGQSNNIGTGVEGPYEVTWSGSGNYSISLIVANSNGCFIDNLSAGVSVADPIQVPIINCSSSTDTIGFTWNASANASDYDVVVLTGQIPSSSTQTSISFTGLGSEEEVSIELTVSNSGACPAEAVQAACSTLPCPTVDVDITSVSDICVDGSTTAFPLSVSLGGSNGTGTGTWSGMGVDPNTGMFDPTVVPDGPQTITYTFNEQNCNYQGSVTFNVFQQPTADFAADAAICINNEATVTFAGTAGTGATYLWNFGDGVATPGTGAGPHTVTWNTSGAKTISLTVEENGCSSQAFIQNTQVDEVLAPPAITCDDINITTETVNIMWDDMPGVTFDVDVLSGQNGTIDNTSISFNGLNPGEVVEILVTATGSTLCGPSQATLSCQADLCPPVDINIDPVDPICLDGNNDMIQMSASSSGGNGSGTLTWSGVGVVDPVNGTFDPSLLGPGDYPVMATYTELNCTSSEEIIITLMPPPVADAGEDHTLSCWDNEAEYRLGGDASSTGANISYLWTADFGPFPDNDGIQFPTVEVPGTYTLTVSNNLVGCSSTDVVTVFANQDTPEMTIGLQQISCQGENDGMMSIESVSGGMEPYLFSLNGAPYVDADTFPFLDPGEYVLAVIDAEGCEDTLDFVIEPPSEVSIELTTNLVGRPLTNLGDPIQLVTIASLPLNEFDSIHWTPDSLLNCTFCLDPMATPTEETEFTVTVYHNGCEATDKLTIFVEYQNPVYVPNIFSPNGDGTNDVFTVYPGPSVVEVKQFQIYDRWGEKVYENKDFVPDGTSNTGWNGNLNGKPMNPQVFGWWIEVELADGSIQFLEGDVTLVR